MKKTLKELRERLDMTQAEAAEYFGISLRSYKSYENDEYKKDSFKYKFMLQDFWEKAKIDEEHGILTMDDIVNTCDLVLSDYPVDFCYLFGSYAKGTAEENSDVDLFISSNVKGLKYYGMVDKLKENLNKNVDVLGMEQVKDNQDLLKEIMKDGVKVYG